MRHRYAARHRIFRRIATILAVSEIGQQIPPVMVVPDRGMRHDRNGIQSIAGRCQRRHDAGRQRTAGTLCDHGKLGAAGCQRQRHGMAVRPVSRRMVGLLLRRRIAACRDEALPGERKRLSPATGKPKPAPRRTAPQVHLAACCRRDPHKPPRIFRKVKNYRRLIVYSHF